MVLVARRSDPLLQLAKKLQREHGVTINVQALDLSLGGAADELKRRLDENGIALDILVNNAGYALFGDFVDQPMAKITDMIKLNVVGVTELSYVIARSMIERGHGHILFVASLTAYQPSPLYAAYAASKAYVLLLGEALHVELASRNVHVTVVSPGLMDTGFLSSAGQAPNAAMKRMMMKPRSVVDIGLQAMWNSKSSVVAGGVNKMLVFATRLLPRSMQAQLSYNLVKEQ